MAYFPGYLLTVNIEPGAACGELGMSSQSHPTETTHLWVEMGVHRILLQSTYSIKDQLLLFLPQKAYIEEE